jgi:hypothetical protein
MSLQDQINTVRAQVRTDGYPVSIGEWISIYEKSEVDIHPEFQRFFRWSVKQKSRLIESILLGIPIPQVFVAQRPDGVWDVVDGVQRLSTIFQFAGILRSEDGSVLPPLVLESTKYLPSLAGMRWEDEAHPEQAFTAAQRLIVKRSKIDVSIILHESDDSAKYELFQRLNAGGSQLSDQELRNSIIVMLNRDFYAWMENLAKDANFLECVGLSDRAMEERYEMELVLRFIALRTATQSTLSSLGDLGEFLTASAASLAQDKEFDRAGEEAAFRETFAILSKELGSDAFRRFEKARSRFLGGFSVSAYEAVALGIGYNSKIIGEGPVDIVTKTQSIWSNSEFIYNSGSGIRASTRIPKIVPFGRKLFATS